MINKLINLANYLDIRGYHEEADDLDFLTKSFTGSLLKKEALDRPSVLLWIQHFLDMAGLVPVAGEAADIFNVGISIWIKDMTNAILSAISLIPGAGDMVGKGAKLLLAASKNGRILGKIRKSKDFIDMITIIVEKIDENEDKINEKLAILDREALSAYNSGQIKTLIVPSKIWKDDILPGINAAVSTLGGPVIGNISVPEDEISINAPDDVAQYVAAKDPGGNSNLRDPMLPEKPYGLM